MLQDGDKEWIAQAVAPLAFRLKGGVVFVAAKAEREDGSSVEFVEAGTPGSILPFSQAKIKEIVVALKKGAHRSKMAESFADELSCLDSVLFESQSSGRSMPDGKPDKELTAWYAWGNEVTERFDQALSAADVKLPPFPEVPSWHSHAEELRAAIERQPK